MSEENKYQEDGEQFTTDYKNLCTRHPVISPLTKIILLSDLQNAEYFSHAIAVDFFKTEYLKNVADAALRFSDLSAKALDEVEIVQDGLYMCQCLLFQFLQNLNLDFYEISKLTFKTFWKNYFYLMGKEGAARGGLHDEHNIWKSAYQFADEFWRLQDGEFPETIAFGVEEVEKMINE